MRSKYRRSSLLFLMAGAFFILTGCGSNRPSPNQKKTDLKKANAPAATSQQKEKQKGVEVEGKRIFFLEGKASIILPKGWQKGKAHGSNLIQIYGKRKKGFTANIGILVKPLPSQLANRDLTAEEQSKVKASMLGGIREKYPSYQLIHEGELEIAGKKAMVFEGKVAATDLKIPMHLVQYALFKGDRFYLITAGSHESSFASQKDLFNGVAQSFEIK